MWLNGVMLKLYKLKLKLTKTRFEFGKDNSDILKSDTDEAPLIIEVGERLPPSNAIHTNIYSIPSFVPKFLFLQFKQFANLLFLILTIIQCFPGLSPFGKQSTAVPLGFIILCSAIREIYEDVKRRLLDHRINDQLVMAHTDDGWNMIKWQNLHVGQLVRISDGEQIPADLLLLSSSESNGIAYIETANLDGETNLKVRQAVDGTVSMTTEASMQTFWTCGCIIRCDPPNKKLYEFNGVMTFYLSGPSSKVSTLKTNNLNTDGSLNNQTNTDIINQSNAKITNALANGQILLRGARLSNTDFIYGIIIYTGDNTKLIKNNVKRKMKRSLLARITNSMMCTQFGLCLLLTFISCLYEYSFPPAEFFFLMFEAHDDRNIFMRFFGFLVLYNGFVPISLYVTLELVQIIQGMFIHNDIKMYDEKNKGAEVKMCSLNSELGEVAFVLSDKTGTLTQNNMQFRMCSIGGVKYANKKGHRHRPFAPTKMIQHCKTNEMKNGILIHEFLTACAVCHTVTPGKKGTTSSGKPIYHATSPDENALVELAAEASYIFWSRSPRKFSAVINGEEVSFDLLGLLEFSSERKRMSVIVKTSEGIIKMYTKGADTMILARLKESSGRLIKRTKGHLQQFAVNGYRTLCFSMRTLTTEEFTEFEKEYKSAETSLTNRRQMMDSVAEMIEKDLTLLGVSAIEDRLQDEVPQTISKMLSVGIRVWVLTGDKLETAVNIGNSCNLLDNKTPMMVLANVGESEIREQLANYVLTLGPDRLAARDQKISLIVDAICLDVILPDEFLRLSFLRLALCCSAVICCRCTPIQKAGVTRLVKENVNGTVLSIGDGANDVAMIQEADVGVGISGQEGMQAALSSDYAITQFKHLDRLLFLHGTLSVFRSCKCVLFSLYKNIFETLVIFLFAVLSSRSDQPLCDPFTIISHSMFFTSWAALILGVMDRPIDVETIVKYPRMYRYYQKRLNIPNQFIWIGQACIHAVIVYITTCWYYHDGMGLNTFDGRDSSLWVYGSLAYWSMVLITNLKALLSSDSISWLAVGGLLVSVATYVLVICINSFTYNWNPLSAYFLAHILFEIPILGCTLLVVLAVTIALLPDLTHKVIRRSIFAGVRDQALWNEGRRGQAFEKLYQPLYKICDIVGLKPTHFEGGKYGFAFAQDDGNVVTQTQLLKGYENTTSSQRKFSTLQSPNQLGTGDREGERSMDDRTVENSLERSVNPN